MDEIDRKILGLLMKDARKKLTEIAHICGMSSTAVQNRVRKMKQKGIIIKKHWDVDWSAFGYTIPVTICVNIKSKQIENLRQKLEEKLIVMGIDQYLGPYDLVVFAHAKNLADLKETEDAIRKIEGLIEVIVNIWNREKMGFRTHVHFVNNFGDED